MLPGAKQRVQGPLRDQRERRRPAAARGRRGTDGAPDYVQEVAERADASWAVQNDDTGWPEPKPDGAKGDGQPGCAPGGIDVDLADLASDDVGVLYGYASPDDVSSQCQNPPFRCSAYLVLDNDYAEPGYGYDGAFDVPLSVTTAHEYNHILQFNLDSNQDDWMFESTAVWAEEKTFEAADDWILAFMGRWARDAHIPITKPTGLRIYGTAVWNHWLELGAGYGPDEIPDAWKAERSSWWSLNILICRRKCSAPWPSRPKQSASGVRKRLRRRRRIPGVAEARRRGGGYRPASDGLAVAFFAEPGGGRLGEKLHHDLSRAHRPADTISQERQSDLSNRRRFGCAAIAALGLRRWAVGLGLAARGESLASHRDGRGAPLARRDDREYREYLREEQRRQRGCIARRMQPDFHHGLLSLD